MNNWYSNSINTPIRTTFPPHPHKSIEVTFGTHFPRPENTPVQSDPYLFRRFFHESVFAFSMLTLNNAQQQFEQIQAIHPPLKFLFRRFVFVSKNSISMFPYSRILFGVCPCFDSRCFVFERNTFSYTLFIATTEATESTLWMSIHESLPPVPSRNPSFFFGCCLDKLCLPSTF